MLSLSKHLNRVTWLDARQRYFGKLSLFLAGIWFPLQPSAQNQPPANVYTYVDQMPQLPGGGGMPTIVGAFWKQLRFPALSIADDFSGRARIYFEVNQTGQVQHIKLLDSTRSIKVDSALIAAVRSLPTFIPGRQHGHPVTVSITLPISCIKPQF
jgi:TonB family protein